MNEGDNQLYIDELWDNSILASLAEYIKIPAKSPLFDVNWAENGYLDEAVELMLTWVKGQDAPGLRIEVQRLPDRTPTILMTIDGESDDTVLIYGHLDKQPEFNGWDDGLEPFKPVFRDHKLYGRGGADDGYAIYAAIAAIRSLQAQQLLLPRIVILIEASEESGSPDLPFYMDELEEVIG